MGLIEQFLDGRKKRRGARGGARGGEQDGGQHEGGQHGAGERRHACAVCQAAKPSASALLRHLVTKHFRGSPFPCVVVACTEKLVSVRQLRDHLRRHVAEKEAARQQRRGSAAASAASSASSASSATPEATKPVARRARRERLSRCRSCGQQFAAAVELYEHERAAHGLAPRAFPCELCDRAYLSQLTLQRHLRSTHLGERPFRCERCPGAFTRSVQLQRHQRAGRCAASGSPHACDLCARCFRSARILSAHLRACAGPPDLPSPPGPPGPPVRPQPARNRRVCPTPVAFLRPKQGPKGPKGATSPPLGLWRCTECGATRDSNRALQRHLMGHLRSMRMEIEKGRPAPAAPAAPARPATLEEEEQDTAPGQPGPPPAPPSTDAAVAVVENVLRPEARSPSPAVTGMTSSVPPAHESLGESPPSSTASATDVHNSRTAAAACAHPHSIAVLLKA